MLIFHQLGAWRDGQVAAREVPSTRRSSPAIDRMIDAAWHCAQSQRVIHLFDGPMCRLELATVRGEFLHLDYSRTSYRIFYGADLCNAAAIAKDGDTMLARPLGASAAVIGADGTVLLGVRNSSVAYYPNRIHPFAGAVEPRAGLNVFDEVRRELREEIALGAESLGEICCVGLVEDTLLRHPELIFIAPALLAAEQITGQLNREEHRAARAIELTPDDLLNTLQNESLLTPVAAATLLLTGRQTFGDDWFDAARKQLPHLQSA